MVDERDSQKLADFLLQDVLRIEGLQALNLYVLPALRSKKGEAMVRSALTDFSEGPRMFEPQYVEVMGKEPIIYDTTSVLRLFIEAIEQFLAMTVGEQNAFIDTLVANEPVRKTN